MEQPKEPPYELTVPMQRLRSASLGDGFRDVLNGLDRTFSIPHKAISNKMQAKINALPIVMYENNFAIYARNFSKYTSIIRSIEGMKGAEFDISKTISKNY